MSGISFIMLKSLYHISRVTMRDVIRFGQSIFNFDTDDDDVISSVLVRWWKQKKSFYTRFDVFSVFFSFFYSLTFPNLLSNV